MNAAPTPKADIVDRLREWHSLHQSVPGEMCLADDLLAAAAEITRLRARIATLESEEVTDAMAKAAGKAWRRSCGSYDDAMRTTLAAALRARGR